MADEHADGTQGWRNSSSEAMEERLKRINKAIQDGDVKRRQQEAQRARKHAEAENKGVLRSAMDGFIGGVVWAAKMLFAIPVMLAKGAAAVAAGVTRKTMDRLAGTTWESDAKQANLDKMGLQEMERENRDNFQSEMDARQDAMERMEMERDHLKDKMREQNMASFVSDEPAQENAGDAGARPEGHNPAASSGSASSGSGADDAQRKKAEAPTQQDNNGTRLLGEVSREYHATKDYQFEAMAKHLELESFKALQAPSKPSLLRAVQKLVCANDPLLNGNDTARKKLSGPNAVLRMAANQVIAQEVVIGIAQDALASGNLEEHMKGLAASLENHGEKSTFVTRVLSDAEKLSQQRDALYEQVRDPRNRGRKTDLGWVAAAYREYSATLNEMQAAPRVRHETPRQHKAPGGYLPEPEYAAVEQENLLEHVEGTRPSSEEGQGSAGPDNEVDRQPGVPGHKGLARETEGDEPRKLENDGMRGGSLPAPGA